MKNYNIIAIASIICLLGLFSLEASGRAQSFSPSNVKKSRDTKFPDPDFVKARLGVPAPVRNLLFVMLKLF